MQNRVILESVLGTGHRFLELEVDWNDQWDYRTQKTGESPKSISYDGLASSIDWDSIVYPDFGHLVSLYQVETSSFAPGRARSEVRLDRAFFSSHGMSCRAPV